MAEESILEQSLSNTLQYKKKLEVDIAELSIKLNFAQSELIRTNKLIKFLRGQNPALPNLPKSNNGNKPQKWDVKPVPWPKKVQIILKTNKNPMSLKEIVEVVFINKQDNGFETNDVRKRVTNALAYLKNKGLVSIEDGEKNFLYKLLKK